MTAFVSVGQALFHELPPPSLSSLIAATNPTWKYRRAHGSQRDQGPVAEVAAITGTDVATYARQAPGMSVDRAPEGRNETGIWFRRHDEYPD